METQRKARVFRLTSLAKLLGVRHVSCRLRWRVLERDGFRCQGCGRRAPDVALEVDHMVPVAKGGQSVYENLQALCWACNRGKSDLATAMATGGAVLPVDPVLAMREAWAAVGIAPRYTEAEDRAWLERVRERTSRIRW